MMMTPRTRTFTIAGAPVTGAAAVGGAEGEIEGERLARILAIERLVSRARIVITGGQCQRTGNGVVDTEVGVESRADAVTLAISVYVLHVEELVAIAEVAGE